MRKDISVIFLCTILLSGCSVLPFVGDSKPGGAPLTYEVNLNDRADDLFKVTLKVNDLRAENAVYQFAATAPGTYQVMDIGRFVREFKAFDESGNPLATEQISTNQWQISEPEKVTEIRYSIAETWDTPVDSNKVYPMAGSSIEEDHVQINGQCVFGYPTGMQSRPVYIKLNYPAEWLLGTALNHDKEGYFQADNYDHVVDSPFLLGQLTKAELQVHDSKVEIYSYSKTGAVKSEQILDSVRDILLAAAEFMDGLPVDRYTFLFHFEDVTYGAWEHSYSSIYTYAEKNFEQQLQFGIPAVVAHEFFHVITPLNIHSEIVQEFNFVKPVPSRHLWLYEGTTEWAAQMMQLRNGLSDMDRYLQVIQKKLNVNDRFKKDYSLRELALESFTPAGQKQFGNIYQRGAIVAGLLDILLLDLSDGKRGLREVINELSEVYGPKRAFSENDFYNEFAERTYPEVTTFFESYVENANPLPIAEFFGKLGIDYTEEEHTGEQKATGGFQVGFADGKLLLQKVIEEAQEFGLRDGDSLVAYNDSLITLQNAQSRFAEFHQLEAGIPYELTVGRDGEELTFTCEKISKEKINRHVMTLNPDATPEQLRLREVWSKNI